MTHAENMIARWFGQAGGELLVGGKRVSETVAEVGTPSFVYDLQVLEQKWTLLHAALSDRFDVYYSVKANPNPAILQFFVERGAGWKSPREESFTVPCGQAAPRSGFRLPGREKLQPNWSSPSSKV